MLFMNHIIQYNNVYFYVGHMLQIQNKCMFSLHRPTTNWRYAGQISVLAEQKPYFIIVIADLPHLTMNGHCRRIKKQLVYLLVQSYTYEAIPPRRTIYSTLSISGEIGIYLVYPLFVVGRFLISLSCFFCKYIFKR